MTEIFKYFECMKIHSVKGSPLAVRNWDISVHCQRTYVSISPIINICWHYPT